MKYALYIINIEKIIIVKREAKKEVLK